MGRERASWELAEGDEIAPGRSVLRALGGGSAYEVLLVWDAHLAALAVAKVLRPDHAEDPGALRDLRREFDLLTRLAHPVLVRGFGAVLDGPYPHVLIEHMEGPSLHDLLRRSGGAIDLQQLLPLALHVASALAYMANEGVVHLDVKPDNIIMGVPPRLIDLSVARGLDRAARLRGAVGTDGYMAPEQCDPAARGPVGSPADVFGLGATLFHAVSGRRPFPRDAGARESDVPEIRWPQLRHEPDPLPERTPAPLRQLIGEMLDADPGARPSAREVIERLEPLVAELPRRMALAKRSRLLRR
jgi:eukaryotic-like serine/threonine-protein kinase